MPPSGQRASVPPITPLPHHGEQNGGRQISGGPLTPSLLARAANPHHHARGVNRRPELDPLRY
jgi:hypothetical protein